MTDPIDLLGLDSMLTDAERATRDAVRGFVDDSIRPNIAPIASC